MAVDPIYGILGGGSLGAIVMTVDRWLAKHKPRSKLALDEREQLNRERTEFYREVHSELAECRQASADLRDDNGRLRVENIQINLKLDDALGRLVIAERQIETLRTNIREIGEAP